MHNDISPLFGYYDAFGWIPNIRGALSLKLVGNHNKSDKANNIWGDVDRYAVEFNNYDGLSNQHYVAASTFHNVSDSKFGKDYIRSFRFFFYGSIHDRSQSKRLIEWLERSDTKEKPKDGKPEEETENAAKALLLNKGVLIGKLIIALEETSRISDREVRVIRKIQNLVRKSQEYNRNFSLIQASLSSLEENRREMKNEWSGLKEEIDQLYKDEKIQYEFEVLLTRDGILLLRDCTRKEYKPSYFIENSPSDYTMTVPIHRLFKTAMNFIKFLFHTNYHHEEEHDTFLPASNLHPYRKSKDFSGIFRHQINAFLNPIVALRRQGMHRLNVDPTGIMNYAKSFVNVCDRHNLISSEEAKHQLTCIKLLEDEINHEIRHRKSLLSSIASQQNAFFIITTVLAFVVAILKIVESGLRFGNKEVSSLIPDDAPWYAVPVAILFIGVAGWAFLQLSSYRVSKREYHISKFKRFKNKVRQQIFNHDSDLNNGSLSWQFKSYIWLQDKWAEMIHSSQSGKDEIWKSIFLTQFLKIALWLIIATAIAYLSVKYLL